MLTLFPLDSFYFTTCLLTSVGYGDIVPVTTLGKVFTTLFVIIAGTVLLHNLTLISMLPLELRRKKIEHAVLSQFGCQLTDDELKELSTGRLINRLKLATNRPYGLEECTREMFSLAMLVRLGKITEKDVKATFQAFRRLDVGNQGKLNSRTIIEGEVMRVRSLSQRNLVETAELYDEDDENDQSFNMSDYSFQQPNPVRCVPANLPPSARPSRGPQPRPQPLAMAPVYDSTGSFVSNHRNPSLDSYVARSIVSEALLDIDAYQDWSNLYGQPHFRGKTTNIE